VAAVAHASPAYVGRLALIRTGPAVRPAPTSLPHTVYRRRRALALLFVVSAATALLLALQGLLGALGGDPLASQRPGSPAVSVYVVQPGDTFWGIAGRLRPDEDPRPLVARMVAAHGSPVLVAGERLELPAAA
jgi:hypothetical protein